MKRAVGFSSLFFLSITLGASLAHLLELPHKRRLGRRDYRIVQRNYLGWNLLGIPLVLAVASTAVQTRALRREPLAQRWTALALGSMVATQAIFWTLTFPVNKKTENFTRLPSDWKKLLARWEYSHAASAILNLFAHSALVLSALAESPPSRESTIREETRSPVGASVVSG